MISHPLSILIMDPGLCLLAAGCRLVKLPAETLLPALPFKAIICLLCKVKHDIWIQVYSRTLIYAYDTNFMSI